MEFINLTGEVVELEKGIRYLPTGHHAKLVTSKTSNGLVNTVTVTNVEGLLSKRPNTFYIVSQAVASFCRDRADLVYVSAVKVKDRMRKPVVVRKLVRVVY